jgi:hypothetical protein
LHRVAVSGFWPFLFNFSGFRGNAQPLAAGSLQNINAFKFFGYSPKD